MLPNGCFGASFVTTFGLGGAFVTSGCCLEDADDDVGATRWMPPNGFFATPGLDGLDDDDVGATRVMLPKGFFVVVGSFVVAAPGLNDLDDADDGVGATRWMLPKGFFVVGRTGAELRLGCVDANADADADGTANALTVLVRGTAAAAIIGVAIIGVAIIGVGGFDDEPKGFFGPVADIGGYDDDGTDDEENEVVVGFVIVGGTIGIVEATKLMLPKGFVRVAVQVLVLVLVLLLVGALLLLLLLLVVRKSPLAANAFGDDEATRLKLPKGFVVGSFGVAFGVDENVAAIGFVVVDVVVDAIVEEVDVGSFLPRDDERESDPKAGIGAAAVVFVVAIVYVVVSFESTPPLLGSGLSFGRGDPSHRSRLAFQEGRSSFLVAEEEEEEGAEVAAAADIDAVDATAATAAEDVESVVKGRLL